MYEISYIEKSMCSLVRLPDRYFQINNLAFSPNAQYLASGSFTILLWSISKGEPFLTLQGHSQYIKSLIFSPNGEYLASGS